MAEKGGGGGEQSGQANICAYVKKWAINNTAFRRSEQLMRLKPSVGTFAGGRGGGGGGGQGIGRGAAKKKNTQQEEESRWEEGREGGGAPFKKVINKGKKHCALLFLDLLWRCACVAGVVCLSPFLQCPGEPQPKVPPMPGWNVVLCCCCVLAGREGGKAALGPFRQPSNMKLQNSLVLRSSHKGYDSCT